MRSPPTTQFGERKAAAPVLQSALMAVMAGLYIGSGAFLTYYPLLQLASWIAKIQPDQIFSSLSVSGG